jgi:hydroxymethylpyrimidine/phosphomethylpyrimidine kinase
MEPGMIPNVLSIAGSDCSGGAGIQADIKAISANGGYAMSVITALTAQNTRGVLGVEPVSVAMIARQIEAIRGDIRVDAVKIGMLGTQEIIASVANAIDDVGCPIVLDPVMVAKGGDRLLASDAVEALRETLLPQSAVVTPNAPEAADLLGWPEARTFDDMFAQASALRDHGARSVLLKGGHMAGDRSSDLLATPEGAERFDAPRIPTTNTHGTGCTLLSALATQLALGLSVREAVQAAKAYVSDTIAAADRLSVGWGHGPLHHFCRWMEAST